MLYVCGTPLGNLEDVTLRVLRVLREADCVAAEDTRRTLKLLNHYNIKTPLTSYHEHNKQKKGPDLLRQLINGRNIALVTDAGMPGISDPGADLIRACLGHGVQVTSAPGATAGVTALVLSGLDAGRFAFEGFLPRAKKERASRLAELARENRTMVLYAAPHHLVGDAADLLLTLGNRGSALAREITKAHEEVWRGDLAALVEKCRAEEIRGEIVLIINGIADGSEGAKKKPTGPETASVPKDSLELVEGYIRGGMGKMDAIKAAARDLGVGKREIYRQISANNYQS